MDAELSTFLERHALQFEQSLGSRNWDITILSALTSGTHFATAAGKIYEYQTKRREFSTKAQRQSLIRRLRETLVKLVVISGVPKSFEAILGLASTIEDEDNDKTFSRSGWTPETIAVRGEDMNNRIYQGDADPVLRLLQPHQDFIFVLKDIVYGLFLSEDSSLSNLEAEIVLLSSLIIQNVPKEAIGHMKGLLRLGMKKEVLGSLVSAVGKVAEYMGMPVPTLPSVDDI
ncbi:hypothetical protein BB8028_0004g04690 [Beauveria bassiana]|uniref:Carboxymuconolactone decarboxylase-like domain-containing protein n=1 Tax=Beauveria bassiana TaxID=176275 RepID=A0A2S7YBH7_BEABA|nr:hypothetical protein BB8028_0004g04690 [Beauveria bassiana]